MRGRKVVFQRRKDVSQISHAPSHLCDDPERKEVPDPRWREKVSPDRFDLRLLRSCFRYSNKVFVNDSEVLYTVHTV
ncbi:hypothetical protein CDAR_320661 [Caerostris darwini]|uniref:Uncharacterized protein n=1 Tax=Caerostris darwini TaxID=1538125 RepID=A0AAV4X092_9ARAC|nr:hypothetical protein CDAR_320661 [Caerostris darwini]